MIRYTLVYLFVVTVAGIDGQPEVDIEAMQKARRLAPELFMKAPERASEEGYQLETHYVTTEDGYILGQHRIPGKKGSPPILLQHGLASMSDSWIFFHRNNRSIAYYLADLGYDVWMGNCRGNVYSRNHTTQEPSDPKFWLFSWHEVGMYDLPSTIDYILQTTGHSKLFYLGHSMGVSASYVLLSMRPEYNDKIRLVISLSPPVLFNSNSAMLTTTIKNRNIYKVLVDVTNTYEMTPYSERTIALIYFVCRDGAVTQRMCQNLVTEVSGKSDGFSSTELPLIVLAMQGGHSAFSAWHFVQLVKSRRFQQWDFGPEKNMIVYGSHHPPEYDLKKITAPVSIHYGETDHLVSPADALHVSEVLPNLVEARRVPSKLFNHNDFIGHKKVRELLYDHLANILKKY
ncbi:lipase 1 [Anabrus simplex]|uniref:lipase 1 n=1 Tax=Anabrus simplex TaxID=316456 RepID=UPI0035A2D68B